MRIKFLSVIVSFLFVSFAITSCLDNDTNVDYSPDATIHAFGLDTVHGRHYKFTINQLSGEIYNQDSMPVGSDTILDRILIDTLSTASRLVTMKNKEDQDSIINIADSIDLSTKKYTQQKPLKVTVWAPDMIQKREYKIWVNVHQQDPDSLDWGKTRIAPNLVIGEQKAVILGERIYVFGKGNSTTVYTADIENGRSWSTISLNGMPENFKLASLINFNSKLYITTEDGNVYNTENGSTWIKDTGLSTGNVDMLLVGFPKPANNNNLEDIVGISGIVKEGENKIFTMTNKDATTWQVITDNPQIVPEEFPVERLSSSVYNTNSGVSTAILVGNTKYDEAENDTSTIVWSTEDGITWYNMTTGDNNNAPWMESPSIMYYNNQFYIFGSGFNSFYSSPNLLVWKPVKKKFLLPEALRDKDTNYSTVVDKNNFIWIMSSNPADVWRGRLNRLGFKRQ